MRINVESKEYFLYVQEYWVRHVFRFKYISNNVFDMLRVPDKTYIYLNPKGFIVNNKENLNNDGGITKHIHFYNDKYFWDNNNVKTIEI